MRTKSPRHSRPQLPLNLLRSFEAAARRLSLAEAAAELGVTPGAVGRSLRRLEDQIGFPLLDRTADGFALPESHRPFLRTLSDAFARIEDAADALIASRSTTVLTLRGYTSFLRWWLIPRLPSFKSAHSGIDVHLIAAPDRVFVPNEETDVRIRYGGGRWRGMESVLLYRDELLPVCSPQLLDPAAAPYPFEILEKQTLLQGNLRPANWSDWLDLAGHGDLQPGRQTFFHETTVAYEAAIAGMGMAIAQRQFVEREVALGQLFFPFELSLVRDDGYYLVYPRERRDNAKIVAFREWLLAAAKS